MNKKVSLTAIILTQDEEINIKECLESITGLASQIILVDSGSRDKTVEIVKKFGVEVFEHPFENQARQFNWALDNLDIKNDWILRLDADEYLTEKLKAEITKKLKDTSDDVSGYYMKRRVYFMGRWIKHGGYYPTWILRLFKHKKGRSEERAMDEHIVLSEGKSAKLKNDFVDDNKKDLTWWIEKHNNYASREADDVLRGDVGLGGKRNFYYKFPPFCRAFLYFIYRYFLCLGFLDGKEGLIFHFLQGCWYRFLVDAKIYKKRCRK